MKILLSAFACNPERGSEAQCGWAWVEALKDAYEVHVLTRTENKKSIDRYLLGNGINNVFIHYCDIPNRLNFYYKYGKAYHVYYYLWQNVAYKTAKKLQKKHHFDVIQHITLGDLRIVGKLWKLDCKFVFGPVGGGQVTPIVFADYLKGHEFEERKRRIINKVFTSSPYYRRALKRAYRIYAANPETMDIFQRIVENPSKCELLTENGVRKQYFTNIKEVDRKGRNTVTILWAGRLVYRKGILFLLDVLESINTKINWKMIIVGNGPQKSEIDEHIRHMKCNGEKVFLTGDIEFSQMKQYYDEADIFVFPSFRETTGTVLFEAMSNGLPIISFRQNGASLLVNEESGILININETNIEKVKSDFSNALINLIEDESKRIQMGKAAHNRIKDHYIWSEKVKDIIY